jgi:hypothetical protein
MKSAAAQKTFKFMSGAMMGFGVGLVFLDSIREAPVALGAVWAVTTVLAGFLGVRVFNVEGKFRMVAEDEENRLRPSEEVKLVIGYMLLAVLLWVVIR